MLVSTLPRMQFGESFFEPWFASAEGSHASCCSAGLYYPRGATLGGSAQVNAMNFAWAPDREWEYIAELTGDESWGPEHMRRHLESVENCTYVPPGTPGHGFDGYVEVRRLFL